MDKDEKLDEIVDELDGYFHDWDNNKKDPHSKLPPVAPIEPVVPIRPEKLVDFNYHPDEYPHNAAKQVREALSKGTKIIQGWEDDLQLYAITPDNFRISISQVQFDYNGGCGYFTTIDNNVPLVHRMMLRGDVFKIMQSVGQNGTIVAEDCMIDHQSGEDTSTVTFKFTSAAPKDYHAFNKYRKPLFTNTTKDTITSGTPIKQHGSGVAPAFVEHQFKPAMHAWDSKWSPSEDLVETVAEIACMSCGATTKEVKIGNEFMRTCPTQGCPNNFLDGIKNFSGLVAPGEVKVEELAKPHIAISATRLIISVFSVIPIILLITYLMQVIK